MPEFRIIPEDPGESDADRNPADELERAPRAMDRVQSLLGSLANRE
ncbi:MAG: hypothetical protein JSU85_05820 [Candidatus Zixiibacteriota bacterium]|nr:MAG: hypothetical protein JSU85_05820 [candidate division Zixibacteria bacterium]